MKYVRNKISMSIAGAITVLLPLTVQHRGS